MADKELFGNSEQLESGHEKDHVADTGNMVGDLINRQVAVDAVNSLIDRFELILSDIRESKIDDSVCGMCEYDGAFVGQSGDWCNECPGFEKDNCFKLSDECRKRWLDSVELPSAQPSATDTDVATTDTISRAAAIALAEEIESKRLRGEIDFTYPPMIKGIKALPSAQRWIPCSERLPEDYTDVLVWFEYYRYGDYNRLYQMHGIGNYMSEYDSWMINHETGWRKLRVFAWMPLPEPYKEHPDADHN